MTDTSTDFPPLKTAERYLQLEVDTFCVECGYNLHAQPVTRDERLGIFICRCPECGRFHPAGTGLTATRPWMNRLAVGLLVLWVLFVLHAIFWIVMGLGVVTVAHTEIATNRRPVTLDGQPAVWNETGTGPRVVLKGTTQPVNGYRWAYTLEDVGHGQMSYMNRRRWFTWGAVFALMGMSAAVALVTGVLMVTFLWHWKRRGYRLALLLPFAVAAALLGYFALNHEYEEIFWWSAGVAFGYALLQAVFMAAGTILGRPIARGVLRMFVPPRPRQHFAFLWRVDGKALSPLSVASRGDGV
jgi:hypothetical protein